MIKIPLNRAIELLEQRLNDVDKADIDLKALQSRIQQDIEQIFGRGSTQSISAITLNALHYGNPEELVKCKANFRQTIQGWIDFINDFHLIEKEKIELSEEEYKKKYSDLLEEWNELVPTYNALLKENELLRKSYDESLSEIRILQEKLSNKNDNYNNEIINILFLGASPANEDRLRIDQEVRDIESRLKMAALRDNFDLKSEWAVNSQSLQQAMLDQHPNIVQFSGHGGIDGIAIEDSLGNAKLIDNDALGSLFELFSDKVECVFLNSCYSESQAKEISKHIPYVIGMKSSVPDKAAIAFATGFYSALGAGKDYRFAYKMGVLSIKLEGVRGSDIPIMIG